MIKFRQKQYVLQESHQRLEESQKFYPLRELEENLGYVKLIYKEMGNLRINIRKPPIDQL